MNVPPQFNQCLGNTIRTNRKAAKLNQNQLAEAAGLTRRFIQELENGRSDISMQTLYKLARAMGTSLDAIAAEMESCLTAGSEQA